MNLLIKLNQITLKWVYIKPKTPWEEIKKYLHTIDQVIIMTVEPGFGGQLFMNDQVKKIKSLSNYINENNLVVDIEVDGGVNYETGELCIKKLGQMS